MGELFLSLAYFCALISLRMAKREYLHTKDEAVDDPDSQRAESCNSRPEHRAAVELLADVLLALGAISFIWFVAFLRLAG